ncbi:MAG: multicopper oxidase domain-containing protein [Gammaproteobacteria bacterium]|nr:multicopper oxidase domain-containing protein [Gammaproteobacteria bacterium]
MSDPQFNNLHKIRQTICLLLVSFALGFGSFALAAKREMSMTIDEMVIDVAPDLKYKVFAFNGQVPGPLIHVQEGDDVVIHVTNNTTLTHTVHWHGVLQTGSWRSDGVPGVTQQPIKPGDTYTYKFKADRIGSLWYHCHVNVNEHVGIRGMWGPLIVAPKDPLPIEKRVTKEVIMMLSTWESENADKFGQGATPYDIEDYFSVNAKSFPLTQPIRFETGDVVRVRFYGAGGAIHTLHSHGHDMLITHKDGLPIPNPYHVDTVLIGPGERYDVIIEANQDEGRFIFHDHVDKHVTARGKFPGGPITVMEYAGTPMDDWYVWKDIDYDPDFFFSEAMKKGYGLFENPRFKGTPLSRERRRHRD